jgi:hypothetical protein
MSHKENRTLRSPVSRGFLYNKRIMRKSIRETGEARTLFTTTILQELKDRGYRFVLVKAVTLDNRYDYIEPHHLVLIPIKQLPTDQSEKDIYEPIDSPILLQWAGEKDPDIKIFI